MAEEIMVWRERIDQFGYVKDIKIPAYVVQESTGNSSEGFVLDWNEEFAQLTGFDSADIKKPCKDLLQAQQRKRNGSGYRLVCTGPCPFRRGSCEAVNLKCVWINTKRTNNDGKLLKRMVNIRVYPYKYNDRVCALHVIEDLARECPKEEFERQVTIEWEENK